MKNLYLITILLALSFSVYGQKTIGHYNFTNGSIEDASGNELQLESSNTVVTTEGADGSANNGVSLKDNVLFLSDIDQLNYSGQITISTWIRQNEVNTEWSAIINKWADATGSYYLGINPENNSVRWNCFIGNIEDPAPITTGEWMHYTATYDGQNIKLFRNGNLVSILEVPESNGLNSATFRIGAQSNQMLEAAYLDSDIDDVRVYNVALTDTEVMDLYNNELNAELDDLVLYDLNMDRVQLAGESSTVKGTILNNSDNTVTDISLTLSGGTISYEAQLPSLTMEPHSTFDFDLPGGFDAILGEETEVMVSVNTPNDVDVENNSRTESIIGYSFLPNKKVVIEEATGTWCGWCPAGAIAFAEADEKYPDGFIGIAVHNRDPMTVDFYDSNSGFTAYPQVHVDRLNRNLGVSPAAVDAYINQVLNGPDVPAVSISQSTNYSPFTRNLIVTSTVTPAIPLQGFYAFSLVITEDGVTGTDAGYDQVNFFANNAEGPMGGYENLPSPVPADQMVYNHVARDIVGGNYSGNVSSILTALEVGETYNFTHVYEVPDEFNIDNINIVSLFLDGNGGNIINAESTRVAEGMITDVEEIPDFKKLAIFPNPSSGESYLELVLNETVNLEVSISNSNGQLLQKKNYGKRSGYVNLPLAMEEVTPGIYLVSVTMDGYQTTKKLIIR